MMADYSAIHRSSDRSILDELSEWAAAVTLSDLPSDVVRHAKRCFLDWLGVTLRGSETEIAQRARRAVAGLDTGGGDCTVLGANMQASAIGAALANGTAAIVLELDDGYNKACLHTGATCIPAILAIAESVGADTRRVLEAIAVGYELQCRIGSATNPDMYDRGFHGMSLLGVLGAASGVAKVLGADGRVMCSALGLAGVNAGGVLENTPAWLNAVRTKPGRVNADGITCAILASEGITGPSDLMESSRGFAQAFVGRQLDRDLACRDLGSRWDMLDIYVKRYPFCRSMHSPIEATALLKEKHSIAASVIRRIQVETTWDTVELFAAREWDAVLDAQWSIPFAVALTLCRGRPDVEALSGRCAIDPQVRQLAACVELKESDDYNTYWPSRVPARVTIETDRDIFVEEVIAPKGEPALTLSDGEIEDKFLKLVEPVVGHARSLDILRSIWSMDEPRSLGELRLRR